MGSIKNGRLQEDSESEVWFPYIQPTGDAYDGFWGKNGYEAFEYGYLRQDHGKLLEKRVIGRQADSFMARVPTTELLFDIVEGMHIRFFCGRALRWNEEVMPMSTVMLEVGAPRV